jgi:tRNA pseudouridine38-40 synthase
LQNLKIIVEYDGTEYSGFQIQKDLDTIQGRLENCLKIILRNDIKIKYASRTDAGVHAKEQVINFLTLNSVNSIKLQKSMNALLPDDIVVKNCKVVENTFDSRRDAKSRVYEYYILNRKYPSAFDKNYFLIDRKLDIESIVIASKNIIGRKDFRAFCKDASETENAVREIKNIEIERRNDFITIRIIANSFLHQMVRIIVGTLVEIGLGKRKPNDILKILESKNRKFAGRTAPAKGLFLTKVNY